MKEGRINCGVALVCIVLPVFAIFMALNNEGSDKLKEESTFLEETHPSEDILEPEKEAL